MAVAGAVALAGDVDPVDATVGGFLDELVVVAVEKKFAIFLAYLRKKQYLCRRYTIIF